MQKESVGSQSESGSDPVEELRAGLGGGSWLSRSILSGFSSDGVMVRFCESTGMVMGSFSSADGGGVGDWQVSFSVAAVIDEAVFLRAGGGKSSWRVRSTLIVSLDALGT